MTNEQTQVSKPLPFWLAASPFVLLIVLFASGTLYMNAGESLIVAGQYSLRDGMPVKIAGGVGEKGAK